MRGRTASLLAGLLLALPLMVAAEESPAKNPDYAHALPDLRTARWLLTPQAGDPPARTNEVQAMQDIDLAIRAIRQGGVDDHKDLDSHEQVTMAKDHAARLQQALDLLHRAHAYISKEVANPGVSVRDEALENIDRAARAIGRAIEAR